ncbi:MAG: oligopeptide transport system permease protein AppB [Thermomicrobiales bacterium]|nr:oligopeptide transport system permease protein AppB [Thermomicrobiales bacterium]MCD6058140.1 oligopeptide transport system permease protein AppB [Thermomicrobiales bacterium]MDF3041166.1 oligopeptide transport system permease protein AppB [Thermomicrobiales bacterium]
MTQYILRRLIQSAFIIWGCATLVFFMLRLIPGDPVVQMLGPEYTPEAAAALRLKLGLNEPLHMQYLLWFGHMLTGDLGGSIATGETVSEIILTGLPKTLSLAGLSFLIAVTIAVPAGIIAALRRNTAFDFAASIVAFVGVSMPSFWFGILLILIFAVQLRWLPAIGYAELTEDGFVAWLERLILPSLAIGAGYSAILMRFVRAGLLEVLGSDYVRTARAKGVRERAVVLRHALRNALIPVVTVIGIQLALLLSGTVVVETVFSIRGIGRILVGAIFDRDYPIVQGVILVIAVIFVLANLIVDIVYTFIDPRIRYG